MKIKMIDLFKKIANGEEVPKKIKYKDEYWNYLKERNQYNNGDGSNIWDGYNFKILNDEVEIIEGDRDNRRKKELEKVKEVIKKNFARGRLGIHDNEGKIPFLKELLFKGKYFKLQLNSSLYCFEVLGTRKEEFEELKKYYYILRDIRIMLDDLEAPQDDIAAEETINILDKYREKIGKQPWLIPIVTMALSIGNKEELEKILSDLDDEDDEDPKNSCKK